MDIAAPAEQPSPLPDDDKQTLPPSDKQQIPAADGGKVPRPPTEAYSVTEEEAPTPPPSPSPAAHVPAADASAAPVLVGGAPKANPPRIRKVLHVAASSARLSEVVGIMSSFPLPCVGSNASDERLREQYLGRAIARRDSAAACHIVLGWMLNWAMLLVLLSLLVERSCELLPEPTGAQLQNELAWTWTYSLVQRIVLVEPLFISGCVWAVRAVTRRRAQIVTPSTPTRFTPARSRTPSPTRASDAEKVKDMVMPFKTPPRSKANLLREVL